MKSSQENKILSVASIGGETMDRGVVVTAMARGGARRGLGLARLP